MQAAFLLSSLPPLEQLIDYAPPTVAPETTVWDTIALMNQYQPPAPRVLVVENWQVVGLFSWENVLQVIESKIHLRNSKITEVMTTSAIKLKYSYLENIKLILSLFTQSKGLPILIEDEKQQLVGYIAPENITHFLLKDYESQISFAEFIRNSKNNKITSNILRTKEQNGYRIDITELKLLEEDLKQALENEQELKELKNSFVFMTFHEFRTPLSTILSSSELLENYRDKWEEKKQLKHFNRIKTAVKHMTNLLNDVLFFAKAESGNIVCNPVNLDLVEYSRQLVEDLQINQTTNELDRPNVNIIFSAKNTTLIRYIDEKVLGHILNNLLSNAIKYSKPGTSVNFTLSDEKEGAVFEIKDEGIGIPSEDLPYLFDSFHRCRNVGNIQGTGLGLSIVKKCLDILQGEINVISEIEVGTKFTVTIPLTNCDQDS